MKKYIDIYQYILGKINQVVVAGCHQLSIPDLHKFKWEFE